MEVAGFERLDEFAKEHPNVKTALTKWRNVVEEAEWRTPAEMKQTFRSADIVGSQTVFNIGGNKSRLIALIHYKTRRVLIQHVLTHAEYDREAWK